MECWAPIDEFPRYHVSTHGRVMNGDTGRILRPDGFAKSGHIQYHLFKNGQEHVRLIHRLVAAAFIGDVEGFDVDHLDNDSTHNHMSNLEIVTHKVNIQRSFDRDGRIPSRMISVRIVETGEEFRSISDCARVLDRHISSVHYALRHGTRTAGVHLEEVIS